MEKRIILVTVIVMIVTVVGKRKTEDAGVRERDTAREKARENIHNLNKRDRKCKNTYEYVKLEQRI